MVNGTNIQNIDRTISGAEEGKNIPYVILFVCSVEIRLEKRKKSPLKKGSKESNV